MKTARPRARAGSSPVALGAPHSLDSTPKTLVVGARPTRLGAQRTRSALLSLVFTLAVSLGLAPAAMAAYGPEALQPSEAPGGYTQVVTAKTIGDTGSTLAGSVGSAKVSVKVPAGTFPTPIQLRMLKPHLGSLRSAVKKSGFKHAKVLDGVGLAASFPSGQGVATLPKPITVTITVPNLPKGAIVLAYDAAKNKYVPIKYRLKHGVITVTITKPVALVVVNPKG